MPTGSKKNTPHTLINTGKAGVVYDKTGHSLGGGESIVLDDLDDVSQAAINAGQLLLVATGPATLTRVGDGASRTD